MLLAREKPTVEKDKPKAPKRPSRDAILALRSDVRKCEDRVTKLTDMREKLDEKLADPTLYDGSKTGDIAVWQKKHAEVVEALDRAEGLWMEALEKLETAEA
jgi:ATP-binding cassette subfamily F protein 3